MILVILFFLFSTAGAQSPTPSGCGGYMFLGENSIPTCDQHVAFLEVSREVIRALPEGNNYSVRGFGSPDDWNPLSYGDKWDAIALLNDWIEKYSNGHCTDPEAVNYTNPFTDILAHLNSGYSGYGIFLEGETDTIVDLSSAMNLARQIASYNADIYVWDISVNNNGNNLFETLTGGKPGHILRGANLTYNDVLNYIYCGLLPDFYSFACNRVGGITPVPTGCPSTLPYSTPVTGGGSTYYPSSQTASYPPTQTASYPPSTTGGNTGYTVTGTPPPTNTSCTSLELIFILERSESTVPFIYENNVTQFVIDFANQFSFSNEASYGSGYARFGLIQFSSDAEVSIPLGNYTRSDFNNQVRQKVTVGDGGTNNVINALLSAYNQFQSRSTLSNKAIMLVVDDVSSTSMGDALDAMAKLRTIVNLPMGVVVPGYSGTVEEGLAHLKILLGNDSNLAFPNLTTALQNAPGLISTYYPCHVPPACSLICFIEEATTAIGATAKLSFLQLVQRLVNTVVFNPTQRFSISFFGQTIYKDIEPQLFPAFNATLSAFIQTLTADDSPNGGQTYLAPILNSYINVTRSGLYRNISALLLGEVEAIKDPTYANPACQTVGSLNTDFYVVDQSRYVGSSSLFATCTGNKPGHVVNGTALTQDQLFDQLRTTLIQTFNTMVC